MNRHPVRVMAIAAATARSAAAAVAARPGCCGCVGGAAELRAGPRVTAVRAAVTLY